MDDPPPTAKRQKTTTTTTTTTTAAAAATEEDDEQVPARIRAEERREATAAKDDRTVLDLLRSLPPNLVAHHVYPFAVKVIENHEELINAVDEYFYEFYSDDEDVGNNRIHYPICDWDVSRVDDFTSVFDDERNHNRKVQNFNEDLSRWNVANGTSFARMFAWCCRFQFGPFQLGYWPRHQSERHVFSLQQFQFGYFEMECGECDQLERNVLGLSQF
jgi:hypothetical protein